MSEKYVKQVILQVVEKVTNIKIINEDRLFFNLEWDLSASDIIYIIDEIEKILSVNVAKIISEHDYRVLSVNGLTEAICSAGK